VARVSQGKRRGYAVGQDRIEETLPVNAATVRTGRRSPRRSRSQARDRQAGPVAVST